LVTHANIHTHMHMLIYHTKHAHSHTQEEEEEHARAIKAAKDAVRDLKEGQSQNLLPDGPTSTKKEGSEVRRGYRKK